MEWDVIPCGIYAGNTREVLLSEFHLEHISPGVFRWVEIASQSLRRSSCTLARNLPLSPQPAATPLPPSPQPSPEAFPPKPKPNPRSNKPPPPPEITHAPP